MEQLFRILKIFILLFAGYFLSVAILRWHLHRRLALLTIQKLGSTQARLMLAVMGITAVLSTLMPNLVCTLLMLPLLQEIVRLGSGDASQESATMMFLGVMYAANIGGVATLIGTPGNLIFVSSTTAAFPHLADQIDFAHWFLVCAPCAFVLLVAGWAYLSVYFKSWRQGWFVQDRVVQEQLAALGAWSRGEKYAFGITAITVLAWLSYKTIHFGSVTLPGWADMLGVAAYVNDTTIALGAMGLLMVMPVDWKRRVFMLDWATLKAHVPKGPVVLILIALIVGGGARRLGVGEWLTEMFRTEETLSPVVLYMLVALSATFLTEVLYGVLVVGIMLLALPAMAMPPGLHPLPLMVAATIGSSCAFMSPIATSPNAIVYATGNVPLKEMLKSGFVFNLISAALFVLMVSWLVPVVYELP